MAENDGSRFIFLWIAFNAAYAKEYEDNEKHSDHKTFLSFLDKLCAIDSNKLIDNLVWNEFSISIRALLNNKHVSTYIGELHRGKIDEENMNVLLDREREWSF
ncbi:MAG: hypothetical protein D8M52_07075 [Chlorobi bacterium]|nr:MAG: hypothetical protein F9K28_06330 [Bacteroidota bacterium]MBL1161465.1 hypothetical protein [Chlorobiota bacterium]MBZ0195693.1 hypothetical protein [Candidatus Kapabacteria bacterium]MCC6331862.1 hypothetical protein [Ignavibacteria bacterium]MCL4277371.1 hypothetical protein [Ignavibacteria bacterium]